MPRFCFLRCQILISTFFYKSTCGFNQFHFYKYRMFDNIDKLSLQKLVLGASAILAIYCLSGLIHEYLIVQPYQNRFTDEEEVLEDRAILVFFPCLITWIIGNIYNKQLPKKVQIPEKNSFYCGLIVFISTITYTWAVVKTSFPVVMAFKSCNLLSVLLVAVLCTRVKQKNLNLGLNKIVVGLVVSFGVFLFSYFDPETSDRTGNSQLIGILFLFISLLADGFLPDFQAQIKSVYKPQPTEMMQQINKWVAIISAASIFFSFTSIRVLSFLISHPTFFIHLVGMSLLSCIGQFVIYYMIKQFKQHIVPFIITLRKIITIGISILFYHHRTSWLQMLGILLVTLSVVYEFTSEVQQKSTKNEHVRIEHVQKFQLAEEDDSLIDSNNYNSFSDKQILKQLQIEKL